ncbi:MAG: ATP-binding cassette domain-containing protein [Dermatophilaceae bacterium]
MVEQILSDTAHHAAPPLRVDDISVRRGASLVVDAVSFEAPAGVTALLGPNGAGKTSLLGAITGQFPVASGEITWDAHRVDGRRSSEFLSTLGWLPQHLTFPRRMKVREILDYAVWLKRTEKHTRALAARAAAESGGLLDLWDRRIGELSGGEQRRVGLAVATVCEPRVILLDEPTVGLDPLQREAFHRRVRAAADGRVVILATHLLEDVAATAASVVVIHRGRVRFAGTLRAFCDDETVTVERLRDAIGRVLADAADPADAAGT